MLFGGSMFIFEAFGGGTNPTSSRMNDYAPVLGFQPRARIEKLSNPRGIVDIEELLARNGLVRMILEARRDAEPWQNSRLV
jgi:hypothetical protein